MRLIILNRLNSIGLRGRKMFMITKLRHIENDCRDMLLFYHCTCLFTMKIQQNRKQLLFILRHRNILLNELSKI